MIQFEFNEKEKGMRTMVDLSKKYKLKRQYKLGVEEECNYILAYTGARCVFLNPVPAFVLNNMLNANDLFETAHYLSSTFNIDENEARDRVSKIIEKLDIYLEEDNSQKEKRKYDIGSSIDILKRNNEFICPIVKAKSPRKIKFYLTDYCPRFCVYCFAGAKYAGNKKMNCKQFLSLDRFKEIIIEAKNIGVTNIEISGGDPFVLNNIYDYLEVMINYFPYDWGTSTKAHLTKDEARRLKEIGLPEIQVSLDSFQPRIADKLMGVNGAFDEVIDTINNLQEAGLNVTTKTTITSLNILDVPELFVNFVNIGIKHLRFSYYYHSANRHSDYLYPSNEQFEWLNQNMIRPLNYAKEKGVTTDYYNHEPYSISNNSKNRLICGGFTDTLCVRPDGGVLFCDSLNHCDEFVAGNLKTQGLAELWNSDGVNNMNNPLYFHERYKGTKCYDCHLFNNCFYKRCYVRTYTKYGKYFDVDPACPFGESDYIIK